MQKSLLFAVLPFYCLFCYPQEQTAQLFIEKAEQALTKKEYKAAVTAFTQGVEYAKKDNNTSLMIKAHNGLGAIFIVAGQPKEAVDQYLLSLDLYKEAGDRISTAKTLGSIANLYSVLKDYEPALNYYRLAFSEAGSLNDTMLMADCLTGEGMVFSHLGDYNSSLVAYIKAKDIYTVNNSRSHLGIVLSLMGKVYNSKGEYLKSVACYKEALGYFDTLEDRNKVAETLNDLGRSFAMAGDYQESLQLHKQAYEDAIAIKFEEAVVDACNGLAIAYEGLHQYKETVLYRKLYDVKKDSLNYKIQQLQLKQFELRTQIEKARNELEFTPVNPLKTKSDTGKNKYILAGCVGFGLTMFAVSGYFWKGKQRLKRRMKRERSKRKLAEDKELQKLRMAKNLHEGLDVKLSRINYLNDSIVKKSIGAPSIKTSGEAVQETVSNMSHDMSDLLWMQSPDEITIHSLVNRMSRYALDYLDNYSGEAVFSIPGNLPYSKLPVQAIKNFLVQYRCVYLILQDLLRLQRYFLELCCMIKNLKYQ